jgi:hypothetical protein
MPNFASMFQNDTEDAREEVEEAHQHIKVAENWTKQVIAGFEAKLDEVRSAREDQATQVHDRASEVKKMVVGEADSVVERVESIASQTENLEKDMRRQMGAFRGKLNSLAGVNVQHDAATAEDMGGKLLQLQQNHQRLMDWATTNKHRTASWRDAVEKNLHALGRSISSDDAELSTMRLDQQVGLTNALRSIASGVQGDMAKAGGEEMRAYEHMTSGFGQGIADVMHKKELSAEEEADAEGRADAALERKQAAQQGALSRAEAKQYELDQTVSALNRKSKEALGAMESLELPMKTISSQNQRTDAKFSDVQRRMTELSQGGSRASSLLQAQHLRLEPGSLLETSESQEAEIADEIAAVKALNEELYNQNMKLSQQNSRLQDGLQSAERKHALAPEPLSAPPAL